MCDPVHQPRVRLSHNRCVNRVWIPAISLIATVWLATAQPPALSTSAPAFEVASIKPSDLNSMSPRQRLGPDTFITRGALKHLIRLAYDVEDYQVEGGLAWTQTDFYDIQAKAGTPSPPATIKMMLQTLLTDRFHLQLARETKTVSGYILTVDKGGPKLPPPKSGVPPDSNGVIQMGGGEIWSRGSNMKHLATALHYELSMPVLDGTNIEGHYDFKLRFEEGNRELEEPDPSAPGSVGSIFTAVRELGLRLEPRKLPIEVFVIQSAERPSEN